MVKILNIEAVMVFQNRINVGLLRQLVIVGARPLRVDRTSMIAAFHVFYLTSTVYEV